MSPSPVIESSIRVHRCYRTTSTYFDPLLDQHIERPKGLLRSSSEAPSVSNCSLFSPLFGRSPVGLWAGMRAGAHNLNRRNTRTNTLFRQWKEYVIRMLFSIRPTRLIQAV